MSTQTQTLMSDENSSNTDNDSAIDISTNSGNQCNDEDVKYILIKYYVDENDKTSY